MPVRAFGVASSSNPAPLLLARARYTRPLPRTSSSWLSPSLPPSSSATPPSHATRRRSATPGPRSPSSLTVPSSSTTPWSASSAAPVQQHDIYLQGTASWDRAKQLCTRPACSGCRGRMSGLFYYGVTSKSSAGMIYVLPSTCSAWSCWARQRATMGVGMRRASWAVQRWR
ncbi:hypothetical protein FIBSPDRAFT_114482 [Athelia psychrophila]|uniref:Uncharacterized protein n=1 Tax=Athelia psychrophila TaxID=1759441 RepID=A0A166D256_9AGAM|nr:hypothetical protein FIBSPDRAFT_114482 [Fibularhizoctonia sp. CBS 109695]